MFCNSRLALPDYDEELKPIHGDFYYKGHLGGMEVMRQKLWTIITITLIKLSAEILNYNINIMCQIDNQVVMVSYPTDSRIPKEDLRESLLNMLSEQLSSVNLKLKRDETWISSRLCEFGMLGILMFQIFPN